MIADGTTGVRHRTGQSWLAGARKHNPARIGERTDVKLHTISAIRGTSILAIAIAALATPSAAFAQAAAPAADAAAADEAPGTVLAAVNGAAPGILPAFGAILIEERN